MRQWSSARKPYGTAAAGARTACQKGKEQCRKLLLKIALGKNATGMNGCPAGTAHQAEKRGDGYPPCRGAQRSGGRAEPASMIRPESYC